MRSSKPRLLDLFCKAGGASVGYARAGFDVVGVDIEPQPNYPFPFIQADVIGMNLAFEEFDAYHASPPCQAFSTLNKQWIGKGYKYPDLIKQVRAQLMQTGKPFVIENVPGSQLINPTALSGPQFGLKVIRRRHFETSFAMPLVFMVKPSGTTIKGEYLQVIGHGSLVRARENYKRWPDAMGIDWMNKKELTQAIPPAYTQLIGSELIKQVT